MNQAQHEAISLLAEECGEVIHIIGKCLRHGLDSYNPYDEEMIINTGLLEHEIGDVLAAIDILKHVGVVEDFHIQARREDKLERVGQWLHHITLPSEEE